MTITETVEFLTAAGASEDVIAAYVSKAEAAERFAPVLAVLKRKCVDPENVSSETVQEFAEVFSHAAAILLDSIKRSGTSGLHQISLPTEHGDMRMVLTPAE